MKAHWFPPGTDPRSAEDIEDDYPPDPAPYEERHGHGDWKTGVTYQDVPASGVICRTCGGDRFNVGVGNYWTGIRCVACGWEAMIHEG